MLTRQRLPSPTDGESAYLLGRFQLLWRKEQRAQLTLLHQLNSDDAEVGTEAATQLRRMRGEDITQLVRTAVRRGPLVLPGIAGTVAPLVVIGAFAIVAANPSFQSRTVVLCLLAYTVALVVLALCGSSRTKMTNCLTRLSLHIETQPGHDAVPWLLQLSQNDPPAGDIPIGIRRSAKTALHRILPEMTADQFSLLDTVARQMLTGLLNDPYEDTGLSVAVINTIAQVAALQDSRTCATLHTFVCNPAITPNMMRIRTASEQALARLDERRLAQIRSRSLLRASDKPASTDSDSLLRPQSGADETAPDQLVRASSDADTPK